ncbi:MAG: site-2 protease family protein [Verrucomicrobia bacterium]|nr:site-2 protease family protein [Verrucomicrobiota bacterium]
MRSSIKIATIFGIDVRIHVTFFLVLAWIALVYYQTAGLSGAIQGVLFMLVLFGCVLLHEFGHALAAREFGIKTPDITLLPIGGVARLSRIPDKPWQELVVAIAGPLVNVVIAAALTFAIHGSTEILQIDRLENPRIELLDALRSINVMLVLFNMIPAFPMDGGRVLRSLLAMVMPYTLATQIAAWIGQGLAVVFAIFGLRGNFFLIFIAFFIFVGAQQEVAMSKVRRSSQP